MVRLILGTQFARWYRMVKNPSKRRTKHCGTAEGAAKCYFARNDRWYIFMASLITEAGWSSANGAPTIGTDKTGTPS